MTWNWPKEYKDQIEWHISRNQFAAEIVTSKALSGRFWLNLYGGGRIASERAGWQADLTVEGLRALRDMADRALRQIGAS